MRKDKMELAKLRRRLTKLEDELRDLPVDEYYSREHELFTLIGDIEELEEKIICG